MSSGDKLPIWEGRSVPAGAVLRCAVAAVAVLVPAVACMSERRCCGKDCHLLDVTLIEVAAASEVGGQGVSFTRDQGVKPLAVVD